MGRLLQRLRLVGFLAFRQLWDRKLLNGIAVSGVALGVLVLIAMNGIMQGFQVRFKTEILKISPHVQLFAKEVEEAKADLTVKPMYDKYKGMDLAAIAEGVETEAQHEFLAANGCTAYQGYLFGRPMPIEVFSQRSRAPARKE